MNKKPVIQITIQNSFFIKLQKYHFDVQSNQDSCIFLLFCFISLFYFVLFLFQIINRDYSPDNHKSLKICIEAIIKNTEMLRCVNNCRKTKTICKNAAEKLPFIKSYVPIR